MERDSMLWQAAGIAIDEQPRSRPADDHASDRRSDWPQPLERVTLTDDWIVEVQMSAMRSLNLYDRHASGPDRIDRFRRKILGKLGEAALAIYLGRPATDLYTVDLNAGDIDGNEVKLCSRDSPRLVMPASDRENRPRLLRPYVLVNPVEPISRGERDLDPFQLAKRYRELYLVGWQTGLELIKFKTEIQHGREVISVSPRHLMSMQSLRERKRINER